MHAERQAGREEAPDETLLAAIEAHAEETLRKSAQWRAEVQQRAHDRKERKAATGGGAVPAD
jgi:hypothetical protein